MLSNATLSQLKFSSCVQSKLFCAGCKTGVICFGLSHLDHVILNFGRARSCLKCYTKLQSFANPSSCRKQSKFPPCPTWIHRPWHACRKHPESEARPKSIRSSSRKEHSDINTFDLKILGSAESAGELCRGRAEEEQIAAFTPLRWTRPNPNHHRFPQHRLQVEM